MRAAGIIFLVLQNWIFMSFIVAVVAGASGDFIAAELGAVIMSSVLGGFFLHRAKQKEQEQEDKEKWNNS